MLVTRDRQPIEKIGGAGGNRTPDPQTASLMLSQLSYSPTGGRGYRQGLGLSKQAEGFARLDTQDGVVFFAAFGRSGGIGIRRALKMPRPHGRVGSSPTSGTHFGGRLE